MLRIENKRKQKVRQKGRLRYAGQEYSNPFFQKKKKRQITKPVITLKIKLILILLIILIFALLWLLFYSPFFAIKSIVVNGQGRIDTRQVEKMADQQINNNYLLILPQKNLLLFSADRLIESLRKKYAFDSLSVNKKLPEELIISFEEKTYAFIFEEGDNYFFADEAGRIITEANLLEVNDKDYPIIQNLTASYIKDQQISIDQSITAYALELFNALRDYSEHFPVSRIIIDNELNTVKLQLLDGPQIYFNTREDKTKQINKLLVIKNEKLKDNFNKRTYIDVRYGDSVYYR